MIGEGIELHIKGVKRDWNKREVLRYVVTQRELEKRPSLIRF